MTYTKPTVEVLGQVHALTLRPKGDPNDGGEGPGKKPNGISDGRSTITGWS